VAGSFRDPSGFVFRHAGVLYRQVNATYRPHYDLAVRSGFYRSAMAEGLLVPHEEVPLANVPHDPGASLVLRPEPLPFVSYPYEWCVSQVRDAALLTLALQRRALAHGLWLKDASAYNVQFRGSRPLFIDTLSFETYPEGQPWVAYRQFCMHFLAPLALVHYRHVGLLGLLRSALDGIPLDLASRLLPGATWLRPSLALHVHLHARAIARHAATGEGAAGARPRPVSKAALLGLADSLEGAVRRLQWTAAGTEWADYYDDTNYSTEARAAKEALVARVLDALRPRTVWDCGANTGVFSRLAAARGISTLALDVDPAAVERNYRRARDERDAHLLPLVMDLTNPSPGLGWDGAERPALAARGPADLVLALALVHHLAIGNNVPLDRIARFLRRLGSHLVLEWVPKSDSQVRRLLASRADVFPDYTAEGLERAFADDFERRERLPVAGSERVLYVFAARTP
jgi:ribosomal protein L11 methylase PrmA